MGRLPAFTRRARLRDKGMLAAMIVAELHEVDSASCDQIAESLGAGRGVVIAACDELARIGYVTKDRGVVALTALAVSELASEAA